MKLHMWVCHGQLKTLRTNVGHRDLLFLPEWLRPFCINVWVQCRQTTWSRLMKPYMWVCPGQLKTLHTHIGHHDILFLPEWLRHFCVNVCVWVQCRQTTWSRLMKPHMWVCRGQLKTLHTSIGHHDLLFLPEWLQHFYVNVCVWVQCRQTTWSRLMKLHMWVCRGQLKTPHTSIGHHDLLFLPEWLQHFCVNVCVWVQCRQTTWSRLMKLHKSILAKLK